MKNRINKVTLYIFLVLIFSISVLNLFSPVTDFSNNENRPLGQFPEFSVKNVVSGKYTKQFETYIQDQFILRDNWIVLKALANKTLFKLENNGVYIGDDHSLIGQYLQYDLTTLYNNIEYIDRINGKVSLMVVPTASEIDKDKLPLLSYNTNQVELLDTIKDRLSSDINYIDVYNALNGKDDMFYKTDHHWNHLGSYAGYQAFMKEKGIDPVDYNFELVEKDFKGTLFSKSGLFYYPGDDIYAARELANIDVSVTLNQSEKYDSLYFDERLSTKDKYTFYLDGNHPIVDIVNNKPSNDDTLLVVKDSYAHIMVPYLVPHYSRIIMIDLRYYRSPINELIEREGIDETLVLYSLDNLSQDRNLALIK